MKLIAIVFAFSSFILALPAWAQAPAVPPGAVPGVEFTKIQDLNPDAGATNRLVKRKWAVVIGTGRFQEGRLNSPGSGDMERSAREFYSYLVDEQAGRFERSHVKMLLDSSATRQGIMAALGPQWLGAVAEPDDLVVVYIATSAFPTTDGNTYLCAYDCALNNIYGTCVSMQTLMETLRQNVHCNRILLVLQAAYSGAAELESGAKDLYSGYNVDLDRVVLGKGYVILSSSQPNEITWNGAFSRNLVQALRGERGMISLQKAFAMARDKTVGESAGNASRRQTPVMKAEWKGTDLVVGTPPIEMVSELPGSVAAYMSAEACYLKATQLMHGENLTESLPKALKEYETAIAVDPHYGDALADYGAALALSGDWQKAADMYKRAIAERPKDELFYVNYARVLDKLGRGDECQSALDRAYSLNNKDMSVLVALSGRHINQGRYAEAVRYLEEAVALYPSSCELHQRLSYACARAGDGEKALAEAQSAVNIDTSSAAAQLNLGSVLMIQGRVKEAVAAYRSAAKLKPQDANVHYLLSLALDKLGDRAAARDELGTFIKLCPPSDPRLEAARATLTGEAEPTGSSDHK